MNCIAIDDEPRALDIIKNYASKVPFLDVKETFTNSLKAIEYLQNNKVDLLFLDIEMPNLSGMNFLRALEKQPMVIFTTAYSEFAVDSFEFNVIDYLLKPIDFNRFVKSTNKALKQFNLLQFGSNENLPVQTDSKKSDSYILVKSGTKIHKIVKDEIQYIKSDSNYVYFYTQTERIISVYTMKEVLKLLADDNFIRVHKSYIISVSQIELIEKHQLTIGQNKIPIGYTCREHFFSKINCK
ncbi:LytTR family DNA-binding domain-containing protein [Ancylomarina sp. DW003]|nr:LytTR family DNA-binding domain-containing protein [Ancylomarina sp. DW003]MDE5424111.1 LytTR family DNA-binding domain-containing protein [Ancylomarina sp. DW003]